MYSIMMNEGVLLNDLPLIGNDLKILSFERMSRNNNFSETGGVARKNVAGKLFLREH